MSSGGPQPLAVHRHEVHPAVDHEVAVDDAAPPPAHVLEQGADVGRLLGRTEVERHGAHQAVGHPGQLHQLVVHGEQVLATLLLALVDEQLLDVAAWRW